MFCTDEATTQYIMSHLDEDLESLAHSTPPPSPLPISPSLPRSRITNGRIVHEQNINNTTINDSEYKESGSVDKYKVIVLPEASTLILQVVRVQDASQSLEQHLRSLTSTDKDHGSTTNNKIKSLTEIDDVTSTRYGEIALQMSEEAEQEAWAKEREKFHNKGSFINNYSNKEERGINGNGEFSNGGASTFTKGTSRYRHLKLELTDGFTRIIAVEDRHVLCNCEWHMMNKNRNNNNNNEGKYNLSLPLFPQGVALGAKIKVSWSANEHNIPRVTCGILRLNGKNTSVIGNSGVMEIQSYCETAAHYLLQSMTGKPARLEFSNPNTNHASVTNTTLQNHENTEENVIASSTVTQNSNDVPVPQHQSTSSSSSSTMGLQPLETWQSFCEVNRNVAHATFHTRAVISGVLNDLEMREYYHHHTGGINRDNNENKESGRTSSVMEVHYSLLVSLSPPPLTSSETTNTSISVTCDLGNTFLITLIGMQASEFRNLHLSHNESDKERVQKLIEHVSMTLEHFGVADFVLQPCHSRQLLDSNTNAHSNNQDTAEMFYRAELIAAQPVSLQ